MDIKVLWESIKEPLREFVLAVIPGALVYLGSINAAWAVVLYAVLRFIDSYLHEAQKALPVKQQEDGLGKLQGLTGF